METLRENVKNVCDGDPARKPKEREILLYAGVQLEDARCIDVVC